MELLVNGLVNENTQIYNDFKVENDVLNKIYNFVMSRQAKIYFVEFPTVHQLKRNRTRLDKLNAAICISSVFTRRVPPEYFEVYFDDVSKKDFYEIVKDNFDLFSDCFQNKDEIESIFNNDPEVIQRGSYFAFEDYESDTFNIKDGVRKGIEKEAPRHIFLFGQSTVFGYYSNDNETIASYLQLKVDDYHVHNCATNGDTIENMYNRILNTRICENDIVIVGVPGKKLKNEVSVVPHNINLFPHIDALQGFYDNQEHENFVDKGHYTSYCHKWLADIIYNAIKKDFSEPKTMDIAEKAEAIIDAIKKETSLDFTKMDVEVGASVGSYNPFTRGHRFLAETGSKIFDYFIIFLFQEGIDLIYPKVVCSKLARVGVADLDNVIIVDLPKLISYQTMFPEYNNVALRHSRNLVGINITELTEVFACVMTKMNIKHYLCGIEADDEITRQSTTQIKFLLPQRNINVVCVPRKKMNNEIRVNGTQCREYLMNGEFEKLDGYLTTPVLNYIKETKPKVQIPQKVNTKVVEVFERIFERRFEVNNMYNFTKNDLVNKVRDLRIIVESQNEYNRDKLIEIYNKRHLEEYKGLALWAGFAILINDDNFDEEIYDFIYQSVKDVPELVKTLKEVHRGNKVRCYNTYI